MSRSVGEPVAARPPGDCSCRAARPEPRPQGASSMRTSYSGSEPRARRSAGLSAATSRTRRRTSGGSWTVHCATTPPALKRSDRRCARAPLADPRPARAVPVRPPRRVARRRAGARDRRDRLRRRRPTRADAGVHPRGARRRDRRALVLPARRRAARAARRPRGVDRAPVRRRPGRDREIVPTLGSKEAIFSFAQIAVGERRLVAVSEPGYPVYERGALFAGAEVVAVPLREKTGWLPDLDAFDRWDELALFWTCFPSNPTGATAPLAFHEELAGRAREHGFLVCSDEVYSELWFGADRPCPRSRCPSARTSLSSTRSRSAGDDRLPLRIRVRGAGDLRRAASFRPTTGTAPQEFVQRASVATSWDEAPSTRCTRCTAASARPSSPPSSPPASALAGGDATFFLWCAVEGGVRGRRAPPPRARAPGRAGLISSARPARATCGSRSSRPRPNASGPRRPSRRTRSSTCATPGEDDHP